MMSTRAIFIHVVFILMSVQLSGQTGERYTEQEIQFQYDFLTAKSYEINNRDDKALESLKVLYDKDRTKASLAFELSKVYLEKEDIGNAINYAKIAVERGQKNQYYRQYLADLYEKNYQFVDAASMYQGLLDNFPENRYYYEKLAYNHLASGNPTQSIAVLDMLENKVGISEESTRRKYDMYLTLGNNEMAEKELIALINDQPEETRYLHNLALFYESTNNSKKQQETYQKILSIDPDDGIAAMFTKTESPKKGDQESYLLSLKELFGNSTIDLKPKLAELIPILENHTHEDTATTEVLLELTQILETTHPNQAPVFAIKGDIYNNINDRVNAIKNYKKTIELDDRVYIVWSQLMYALLEEKEYAELIEYGDKSLFVFPNQPLSYFMIAKANILSDKSSEAKDYIMEGKMISGKNQSMKNDFDLLDAQIEISQGNNKKAIEILDKIMNTKTTKNSSQYEVLGDMYNYANNTKKAKAAYQEAIKLDKDNINLKQKVQSLEK